MSLFQIMVKVKAGISRVNTIFGWWSCYKPLLLLGIQAVSPCPVAAGAASGLGGPWRAGAGEVQDPGLGWGGGRHTACVWLISDLDSGAFHPALSPPLSCLPVFSLSGDPWRKRINQLTGCVTWTTGVVLRTHAEEPFNLKATEGVEQRLSDLSRAR